MKTSDTVILGVLAFIAVLLVIAAIYAFGGLMFMLLWNWLVPTLWHAAPHLTWIQGIAASWLLAIVQSIFGGGIKIKSPKND